MRATRHSLLLAIALGASVVIPTGVTAADPTPRYAPADEVLVRYRQGASTADRRGVARELGLSVISSGPGLTDVVVGKGISPATVRRRLAADPRVEAVAPNHRRELADEITDDPYFGSLWGIHNRGQRLDGTQAVTGISDIDIDGLEALRVTRGDPDVVVAVIDDGVDFSHPDLASRAWTNPAEVPGNGLDDDDNGYVDDINGWDFCHGDATVHDAGLDGHGTHVAGTIAGAINGIGMVGVAPGVRIMALKFIEDGNEDCGFDSQAIDAIDYAASFDVPIINASWGGTGQSDVLDDAVGDSGALFVAASGNAGRDIDLSGGAHDFYPAETARPNVLSVGAVDQRGAMPAFSNYGRTTVDVAAPGVNILSAYPGGWAWAEGTSMAAPHVSGVAALIASVTDDPISPTTLKSRIMDRGTSVTGASGRTVTGRIVNAYRAIDVTAPTAQPIYAHTITAGTVVGSSITTTLSWPPAVDDLTGVASYLVRRRLGSGSWTVIAGTVTARSTRAAITPGTPTQFAVAGRDRVGNLGAQATSPAVTATLYQDGTSLATYAGRWSATTWSGASHRNLRTSTTKYASVEFRTSARSIGVVGRQGPTSGKAWVYVDGLHAATIDLYRSSARDRVVLFGKAWSTPGVHTVKVIVAGTTGRPRVDIDAFAVLR